MSHPIPTMKMPFVHNVTIYVESIIVDYALKLFESSLFSDIELLSLLSSSAFLLLAIFMNENAWNCIKR